MRCGRRPRERRARLVLPDGRGLRHRPREHGRRRHAVHARRQGRPHPRRALPAAASCREDVPWVHVDLSSRRERKGGLAHVPTEFTGFGVRFALHLLGDGALLAQADEPRLTALRCAAPTTGTCTCATARTGRRAAASRRAQFARALVMPNLQAADDDHRAALGAVSRRASWRRCPPAAALRAADDAVPHRPHAAGGDPRARAASGFVVGAKLYPAGATTNSDAGVTSIDTPLTPRSRRWPRPGCVLQVHGEVTEAEVDVFDREQRASSTACWRRSSSACRGLQGRVRARHDARPPCEFVRARAHGVAATITPQHLLLNRNALFDGGIRPHHYCLPVLKRERDREALLDAATSDDPRFFLGTDSAPHARHTKETACGCAGIFSAHAAHRAVCRGVRAGRSPATASRPSPSERGADFYGLPRNAGTITLRARAPGPCPRAIRSARDELVPMRAGATLALALVADVSDPDSTDRASPAASAASCPWWSTSRPAASIASTDALLEIAAVIDRDDADAASCGRGATHRYHVQPFHGSRIDPASLAVNGIDPHHPLRPAMPEKEALHAAVPRDPQGRPRRTTARARCWSGHNASFDLGVPECGGRAHRHQAQPVPPVLELRHGHARRRRARARRCCRAR